MNDNLIIKTLWHLAAIACIANGIVTGEMYFIELGVLAIASFWLGWLTG